MIKRLGEILVRFDTPRERMVTFVASDSDGCVTLEWMHDLDSDGTETLGEWDGTSLTVAIEDADSVYQAALMNGHSIGFADGESIQLPEEFLPELEALIEAIQARDHNKT